ncbi:hypothetical protein BGX31_009468 [Mortierella sp. GBA43]|nr:hypothetical protein BGX31_009468 [Mortierella sp. GBA43]
MGQELESSAIPANEPNAGTNIGHWLLSPSADTTDNHGRPFTRNAGVLDLSALQPSDTSSDTLDPVVGGTASSVSHKNSNGINSSQGDNNPAVGITSRPDVVAGVIILSLGILVLLVAITFYLINGRSWKSPRRQRCKQGDQDNHDQVDSIEAGLKEKSAHSRDEGDDEALETSSRPGPSKRSSTSSQQPCDTAVAAETVMSVSNERRSVDNGEDSHGDNDSKSNDDDDDDDSEDLNPPEGQGHKTYDMPQPEHSPTTARLENPPVNKSVFAFLKGTTQSHNHHGHRDPFYATDLPALTRIKARSSIEQKTNRLLLPHGTRCPTPNVGSKARSHLSHVCYDRHGNRHRQLKRTFIVVAIVLFK